MPKENVVGEPGKGYKIAIETLNEGRIGIGAQMIGVARGALEFAIAYTKERKQFGTPIAEFQGVQVPDRRGRHAARGGAPHGLQRRAAQDTKRPFLREAAMAKLLVAGGRERSHRWPCSIFGGNGYTKEYPVEKFWRDSKVGRIYEGTSNMQLATIAESDPYAGGCRRFDSSDDRAFRSTPYQADW